MASSESIGDGQQNAGSGPALGDRLRQAREAQELSLDDVAAELRIGASSLLALEESRFEALGARVFAKGYLKQYGARLGLDVAALAADFDRTAGQAGIVVAPSQTIRLRDERQITLWIVAALVLVALVGFLLFWWLQQTGAGESAMPSELAPTPASAIEPLASESEAAPASTTASATEREAVQDIVGVPDPATSDPVASEAGAVDAAPAAAATTTAAETTQAAATSVATEATPAAPSAVDLPAPSAALPAPIEGPVLEVRFVADSWAEITAGDGERLFYGLGDAGTTERFAANPDLVLLFGNAGGVELNVDGRPVAIPGSPRSGQVARFGLSALLD